MIYKIIVDKQPMSNPSEEKREYEIDIEELRTKHDVYDSLVITYDEDYVMRRLSLNEYKALNILETPIKEPLEGLNIELFEGDNYIYLIDVVGEKLYAEYLVKNEFNELYVVRSEMNSAINQSARAIELGVNQKLTKYSTTEEMNSAINITAESINSEVSKKVGDDEIISKINQSAEKVTIDAQKININGTVSANGNFQVDVNGNMSCNNGIFNGGQVLLQDDGSNSANTANLTIKKNDNIQAYLKSTAFRFTNSSLGRIYGFIHQDGGSSLSLYNYAQGGNIIMHTYDNKPNISLNGQEQNTTIYATGIVTPSITQTSKEEDKKNFEELSSEEALNIIKDTDIYKYNMKFEDDNNKKHIGFVIGEKYKHSKSITAEDEQGTEIGVDNYSMISAAYKVIQIQQQKIEELEQRLEKLEKGDN